MRTTPVHDDIINIIRASSRAERVLLDAIASGW